MTLFLKLVHLLNRHYKVFVWGLALAALSVALFTRFFILTVNISDSLPGKVFLVMKDVKPARGDFVAFYYSGGGVYPARSLFLKRLVGLPGDKVSSASAPNGTVEYFIDGHPVGQAKPTSKKGLVLQPGPTGVIPAGSYYVAGSHADSLDSRYKLVGWVQDAQIIGKSIRIW